MARRYQTKQFSMECVLCCLKELWESQPLTTSRKIVLDIRVHLGCSWACECSCLVDVFQSFHLRTTAAAVCDLHAVPPPLIPLCHCSKPDDHLPRFPPLSHDARRTDGGSCCLFAPNGFQGRFALTLTQSVLHLSYIDLTKQYY